VVILKNYSNVSIKSSFEKNGDNNFVNCIKTKFSLFTSIASTNNKKKEKKKKKNSI